MKIDLLIANYVKIELLWHWYVFNKENFIAITALLDLVGGGFANSNEADTFHYGQNDKQWRIKVFSLKFLKGSGCSFLLKLVNWVQLFLTLLLVIIVVGLIFWDIYFVLDFRSNFF